MSDYNRHVLLAIYYSIMEHAGSPAVIDEWSQDLHGTYNAYIVHYGELARVPLGPDERTVMATIAYLSPPADVPESQAQNAVAAYRAHLGV